MTGTVAAFAIARFVARRTVARCLGSRAELTKRIGVGQKRRGPGQQTA